MRTLLAKCCVLALIAGGFAFTGDAGRVFARGRRVLEATTLPKQAADAPPEPSSVAVPSDAPSAPVPAASEPPSAEAEPTWGAAGSEAAEIPAVAETPAPPRPSAPPADAPIGNGSTAAPVSSPESIDLATLSPGDRVVVWIGRRGGRNGAAGGMTIALDVIDPESAEVLEQRHAGSGDQGASHAPLRRIRVLGSATESFLGGVTATGPSGRITRRHSLRIVPVDRTAPRQQPSAGQEPTEPVETIGPVQAMAVTRATTAVP